MSLFFKSKGGYEFLIVGLGNPDKKYEKTRHNAGYRAIDKIAEHYNTDIKKLKFKSLVGEAVINSHKCLLMKPTTYMNLSGQAVVEAMNFYKIPISNVIVLFDDISLEVSKLRIRRKGSDGGHNGIKNIIYLTGQNEFPRIKLGVGKKPHPDYDLADWVLSNFSADELKGLNTAIEKCPEIIEDITDGFIDKAMNKYN